MAPLDIKAHFRDLIAAVGGPKRAAELVDFHASHLSEAGAAHNLERWPRIDHVVAMEAECRIPIVTAAMADRLGYDLVPRTVTAPHLGHSAHLRSVMAECADVALTLARAMEDGQISPRERRALLGEVAEAQKALEKLRLDLAEAERGQ